MPFFCAAWVVDSMLGQLGRAVKAIDSKSIGVTRVSSSLTAVDLLNLRCVLVRHAMVVLMFCRFVV